MHCPACVRGGGAGRYGKELLSMGILNDISKKAQEYAGIAVDKAKALAEVAAD